MEFSETYGWALIRDFYIFLKCFTFFQRSVYLQESDISVTDAVPQKASTAKTKRSTNQISPTRALEWISPASRASKSDPLYRWAMQKSWSCLLYAEASLIRRFRLLYQVLMLREETRKQRLSVLAVWQRWGHEVPLQLPGFQALLDSLSKTCV